MSHPLARPIAAAVAALPLVLPAVAAAQSPDPAPGVAPMPAAVVTALDDAGVHEIVVRRRTGLDRRARRAVRAAVGGRVVRSLRLPDTGVTRAPGGELAAARGGRRRRPDVRFAEVAAPVAAATADMYWSLEWGLQNLGQAVGVPATAGVAG